MSEKEFKSGARRERKDDKSRIDLVPAEALYEWGMLMLQGAHKIGERNWEKGFPLSSFIQSACRHLNALMRGEVGENHAANILFNIGGFIATRAWIAKGDLSEFYNDLPERMKDTGRWEKIRKCDRTPIDKCPFKPSEGA